MKTDLLLIFLLTIASFSCQNKSASRINTLPYDLEEPKEVYELPGRLDEVSGLGLIDNKHVACVQDEDGKVFIYDIDNDELDDDEKFGKDNDYEGIEIVGEEAWVVRSNGKLYRIKKYWKDKHKRKGYDTPLSTKNNVEGLCYDKENERLLLACKGEGFIDKDRPMVKTVYGFSLEDKVLSKKPVLKISLKEVYKYLEGEKLPDDRVEDLFNPSGIAIHPITKQYYLISTKGKVLVILNKDGSLYHAEYLDDSLFIQPEGITFQDDGDMLISNEGRGGDAFILKFKYKP